MNKTWRAAAFASLLACLIGTADIDIAFAQNNYPKASRKKPRQTVTASQSVTQDAAGTSGQSSGYVSEEELERMRQRQAANEAYKKSAIKSAQQDTEYDRERDKLRNDLVDFDLSYLDSRIEASRNTLPRLRKNVSDLEDSLGDDSIRKLQREELAELRELLEEYNNNKIAYASQPKIQAQIISKYRTLADLKCKYVEVYEQVLDKRGISNYTKARSLLKF
ncbi:hypothetical protein IJT93_11495 [bacterium]|nr:hypothetical protein [bacterium]